MSARFERVQQSIEDGGFVGAKEAEGDVLRALYAQSVFLEAKLFGAEKAGLGLKTVDFRAKKRGSGWESEEGQRKTARLSEVAKQTMKMPVRGSRQLCAQSSIDSIAKNAGKNEKIEKSEKNSKNCKNKENELLCDISMSVGRTLSNSSVRWLDNCGDSGKWRPKNSAFTFGELRSGEKARRVTSRPALVAKDIRASGFGICGRLDAFDALRCRF